MSVGIQFSRDQVVIAVDPHTGSWTAAAVDASLPSGKDYRETFQVFQPGFDLTMEREARAACGRPEWLGEDDLYSDVCYSCCRGSRWWTSMARHNSARSRGAFSERPLTCSMRRSRYRTVLGWIHSASAVFGIEPA